MTAVGAVPVLRLAANNQLGSSALDGERGSGYCLDLRRVSACPDVLLADLDPEQPASFSRYQAGEDLHAVLGLVQGDGGDLHPRVSDLPADRLAVISPVVELQVAHQDGGRQCCREWILAPAL